MEERRSTAFVSTHTRNFVFGHSLRAEMFRYSMLLITIPVILIGLCSFWIANSTLRSRIDRNESLALAQIAANLEYMTDQVKMLAGGICVDVNILRAIREYSYPYTDAALEAEIQYVVENTLRGYFVSNHNIQNIFLKNNEGREINFGNYVDTPSLARFIYPLLAEYQNMSGDRWVYIPGEGSYETSRLHYICAVKDYYKGNVPIGLLIISIQGSAIEDILNRIQTKRNDHYFILDSKGECIYNALKSSEQFPYKNIDISLPPEDYQLLRYNGKRYVALHRPLAGIGWYLVSASPLGVYLSDIYYIRIAIVLTGLIAFITAIMLDIRFSRKLSEPLNRLANDIQGLQNGQFFRENGNYSADEFGYIQQRFDKMAIEIKGLIDKVYQQQEAKRIAELNALQAQINPHFLYNTLNSVHCLAQVNHQQEISDIMVNLGALLRVSLSSQTESLFIEDEIEYTRRYLHIANIRWENRFELSCDLGEELKKIRIPKLTLQPLVENCIKHGFADLSEKGLITIVIFEEAGEAVIEVRDNGTGLDPEKIEEINERLKIQKMEIPKSNQASDFGIGIFNVNARLFLYYGERYGLHLYANEGGGLRVRLLLPMPPGIAKGAALV